VSVYRLGKAAIKESSIALAAAAVMFLTPVGLVLPLLIAGCAGIALFYSSRIGLIAFVALIALAGLYYAGDFLLAKWSTPALDAAPRSGAPDLWALGIFFLKVGAFTFGGGLSMLAFIQEQVVNQFGWLTPREFVDGLALGQLTPGPILMLAAFVGYKIAGVTGAAVAASAIFLPSFLMILSILPLLSKMKDLQWLKHYVADLWRRTLRRRSQKDGFTWERVTKLVADWLPVPRILHPWPDRRFAVKHPR
jgi:chromate transporter